MGANTLSGNVSLPDLVKQKINKLRNSTPIQARFKPDSSPDSSRIETGREENRGWPGEARSLGGLRGVLSGRLCLCCDQKMSRSTSSICRSRYIELLLVVVTAPNCEWPFVPLR